MYFMSKMQSDGKPPIARSPFRLRPRRVLGSSANSISLQTPSDSLTKTQKLNRSCAYEESELRPEYRTISCELKALTKLVQQEFGDKDSENIAFGNSFARVNTSPPFERGRFYNEYSARRNERLKRKQRETGEDAKPAHNLGVTVESAKKTSSTRKRETLRKSVSAAYSVERHETPRYMLRSMTKENKKPPLPSTTVKDGVAGERKIGARRVRRI